jgi:hypothetical protein
MHGEIRKKPKHGSGGTPAGPVLAYILKAMKIIHKQNITGLIMPSESATKLVTEYMHSVMIFLRSSIPMFFCAPAIISYLRIIQSLVSLTFVFIYVVLCIILFMCRNSITGW